MSRNVTTARQEAESSGAILSAGVLAFVGAAGTALLAVGHAGVTIPFVSALGPGTGRAVWPAAAAFAVATVLYLLVGTALVRRARPAAQDRPGPKWALPGSTALFGATIVAALVPFRGVGSVAGAVLGLVGLTLLAIPGMRRWPQWNRRSLP